jgi:hypothetical protein
MKNKKYLLFLILLLFIFLQSSYATVIVIQNASSNAPVKITNITNTSEMFTVNFEDDNSDITEWYEVHWGTSSNFSTYSQSIGFTTSPVTLSDTILGNTTYYFRLRAIYDSTNGDTSDWTYYSYITAIESSYTVTYEATGQSTAYLADVDTIGSTGYNGTETIYTNQTTNGHNITVAPHSSRSGGAHGVGSHARISSVSITNNHNTILKCDSFDTSYGIGSLYPYWGINDLKSNITITVDYVQCYGPVYYPYTCPYLSSHYSFTSQIPKNW